MEIVTKKGATHISVLIRKDLDTLSKSTNNKSIRKKIDTVIRHLNNLQVSIIKSKNEDWYEQRKT